MITWSAGDLPHRSQNFVRAFAVADHPLVIFLDDLQWSDPATLKMLHLLLTDPGSAHLLVIGSCRDEEVGPAHPLSFTLDELRKAGTTIGEILVGPLTPAEVTRFVQDALGVRAQEAEPLAKILFAKTHGSPFFLSQFLTALYKAERICFDARSASWTWDARAIEAMPSAENVAELIASQIQKLPESTQNVLMLAACIGHRFDLQTLSIVSEMPRAQVAADLWEALRRDFLLPLDSDCRFFHGTSDPIELLSDEDFNVSYQFLHDRVQQAAYSLLGHGREQEVHLRIGRLMLAKSGGSPHDDELFDVVNHLNRGAGLILSPTERSALARLNLAAGQRAKPRAAYQAAASYLAAGMSLLEATRWDDDHALCYALHVERAEAEFLNGRFDEAELLFETLISRAESITQEGQVHALRMVLCCIRGEFAKALEIGRAALALFGLDLPTAQDARKAAFAVTAADVERGFTGRTLDDLLAAPEMIDPEKQVMMTLLSTLMTPAISYNASLYPLLVVTMVSLSLTYGPSDMSADGYALYGSVLMGQMGRYREASEFARLGLELNERFNNHRLRGRLNFVIGTYSHAFAPLQAVIGYFQRAKQLCLESGNFLFTANACCYLFHAKFAIGVELAALRDELDKHLALAERTKAHMGTWFQRLAGQVISNLMGHTEGRHTLSGGGFDEAAFVAKMQEPGYAFVAFFYDVYKAELLFLYGEDAGALAAVRRAESRLNFAKNLHVATELLFYKCLLLAALYPAEAGEQAASLHSIDEHHATIARFAESCPENFRHKQLLVAAERARITGEELQAMKLYDQAIAAARSHGFVRDEALANELCARFHRAHDRERISELYLADAHHAYTLWGATSKAKDLEERYPRVIARATAELSQGIAMLPADKTATITGTIQTDLLDLSLVARAAEAISGEAALDKVLERVMQILLESSCAERAVLLWDHDGEMRIEASIMLDAITVEVGPPVPMASSTALPLSILYYVERSHDTVVLGDAADERSRFLADPYITRARPKSVMCVPMVHHGRLAGILYLEHSLVRSVFTEERRDVCCLLASQAMIAIENTRLYEQLKGMTEGLRRANESLEADVARRTEELSEANSRLQLELADRVRAEEERAALQAEIIQVQRARIAELSAPLMPIMDRIMVMPLIGVMDAERAEEAVDTALRGAERNQTAFVIVDVTGIKDIDARVASTLMRMASALRLIGTHMVLTGISPQVAQIMVGLEVDLGQLATRGDLRTGVAYAMEQLRLHPRQRRQG